MKLWPYRLKPGSIIGTGNKTVTGRPPRPTWRRDRAGNKKPGSRDSRNSRSQRNAIPGVTTCRKDAKDARLKRARKLEISRSA
jgi:hypothetical protein